MTEPLKTLSPKLYKALFKDYTLTQPPVWSKCNDERSSKYRNLIRKRDVNPLWWAIPPATIFQNIKLRTALTQNIRFHQINNLYSISDSILSILYPIILGLGRIETNIL
ncbi:MAG: hypothetical protein AB1585_08650, partial [Thermodesulfobacteriota bacterium]